MPEKGFATAEDFRRLRAEELARAIEAGEVHKVTLPSGLDAQLRHPGAAGSELFSLLNRRMWEAVEAEREKNRSLAVAEQKVDAVIAYSDFLNRQLSRVFVRPGWGVAHDEIGLGDIGQPDLKYIFRWLGGEVSTHADGSADDLAPFPGGPGSPATVRVAGAREPLPAEPVAGVAGSASPAV